MMVPHRQHTLGLHSLILVLVACACFSCTNNPYRPNQAGRNIYYDTFSEEPKHLDPARSYSSDEYEFINQIYEPVVQYHYLLRPYTLVPLTAVAVPEPQLYGKDDQPLPSDAPASQVTKVVYEITLQAGIRYQNHPSFARHANGTYRWHLPPEGTFPTIEHPNDLPEKGTRDLRAEDYAYQIKRLAHPLLECPIFPILANYIDGLAPFRDTLEAEIARIRAARRQAAGVFYNQEADERVNPLYLDLRQYDFPGVEVIDERTFRITLTKKYPQFLYWLAMPFFSPVPWEVDRFYTQAAAVAQNITLDRFPVGTGPFTLAMHQPNYRMVLQRNANFHQETYPAEGDPEDKPWASSGSWQTAAIPGSRRICSRERGACPAGTNFCRATMTRQASAQTCSIKPYSFQRSAAWNSPRSCVSMQIRLLTDVAPSTNYYAFNMLDDVVGGYDEKKRKLRQALSIALNMDEYIQIFLNGRGIAAQGPIPPGIFGYQEGPDGIDPVIYDWDAERHMPRRKSVETAKRLLAEAGYPDGRDANGTPLVIFFDTTATGAGSKPLLDWLRKQFAAIGVQLQIRATDYNQFQSKVLRGNYQLIRWGWNADYPDPENFLFLLYGPNAKVTSQGENAANYDNPRFNALFQRMENMTNTPERAALIQEMLAIAREDAPWMWGVHPVGYGLYHSWYYNAKPMTFGGNTLKYKRLIPPCASKHAWPGMRQSPHHYRRFQLSLLTSPPRLPASTVPTYHHSA